MTVKLRGLVRLTLVGIAAVGTVLSGYLRASEAEGPVTPPTFPTPILPEAREPTEASPGVLSAPFSLDFSAGRIGEEPTGWVLRAPGYGVSIVDQGPGLGLRAARLSPLGRIDPAQSGAAMLVQVIQGDDFKGKVIEFSAMVRVTVPTSAAAGAPVPASGRLVMRVDRLGGAVGFFDNMADRPIRKSIWQRYTIVGQVESDATTLTIGGMALSGAVLELADARLRVIEHVPADGGNKPPATLSERALANIGAFARLYGYVRWFHPSDEARDVDWNGLLIAGLDHVESASSPSELVDRLREVFAPIAPSVVIYETAGPAPAPPVQPAGPAVKRVVGWRHVGFGQDEPLAPGNAQVYKSTRLILPVEQAVDGQRIPKPGALHAGELGGGASVIVPVTLLSDEQGTLPRAGVASQPMTTPVRPDGWRESFADRTVRLAAVALLWNVIEHFYPYHSVMHTDWSATLAPALQDAASATGTESEVEALQRLLAKAKDGHGQVMHPDEVMSSVLPLSWTFVGKDLVVTRVTTDWQEYIRPGDLVIAIDNLPIDSIVDLLKDRISAATDAWMRKSLEQGLRTAYRTSKAPILRLQRPGGGGGQTDEPFDVHIRRFKAVDARGEEDDWLFEARESRPEDGSEVAPGVVYFDLDGKTRAQLHQHLAAMQKAKGLVFDMRGYPNDGAYELLQHLSNEKAMTSAKWTVPVVITPDKPEREFMTLPSWVMPPMEPKLGAAAPTPQKVAFIIDGRAISYAESILAIVEHYKLGALVGEPTAGTNGNVNPFRTPGGAIVYFTGMRVLKHDGSVHHGVGIKPTVPVSRTREGIREHRDELLEAAIKAVQ